MVFKLPLDLIPWKLVALKCGLVCVKDELDGVQVFTSHRAEMVGPTGEGVNAMQTAYTAGERWMCDIPVRISVRSLSWTPSTSLPSVFRSRFWIATDL